MMHTNPSSMKSEGFPAIERGRAAIWQLRDVRHAMLWLSICSVWGRSGKSGQPPIDPFRLWGWSLDDIAALTAPLTLLPHALSFKNPNSPEIRAKMAQYPSAFLRWALLCLRQHGEDHAKKWAELGDRQTCAKALSIFLSQQWLLKTGAGFDGLYFPDASELLLPSADTSEIESSPYRDLIHVSLWDKLISMQTSPETTLETRCTSQGAVESYPNERSEPGHRHAGLHSLSGMEGSLL